MPLPKLVNEYMTDLGKVANRSLMFGLSAGGVYVPLLLNADGSINAVGNNNIVAKDNVTNAIVGAAVGPASSTTSPTIDLQDRFAIGVQLRVVYHALATLGVTLRLIQGVLDAEFDTVESAFIEEPIEFFAGGTRRKSFLVYSSTRYMRVVIENTDPARALVDLDVDVIEI